jgi:signal transduction histidine kinase
MNKRPPAPGGTSKPERREAELQALYWITQAVNFTVSVDDIMELIYTQLQRVIPTDDFYIALVNAEEQTLSFAFYVEGEERYYPNDEWSLDQGLTGLIARKGLTVRTDDYGEECERRGIELCGDPNRAWMGAPLMAQDQIVGVMVAATDDPGMVFSAEDESFFLTVAAYTASLIERNRLYEELESRAAQLHTLNEIGNLLSSSLDLNEVLSMVVRQASNLLEAEAGSLLLLDDDSGDLIFRTTSGPTGKRLVGLRVPAGKGIAGTCFADNTPIIVNDAQNDERWYSSFDQQGDFTTRSLLAVPLNARGRTIGVLEVLNHKDDLPFKREDVELLLSFGAQASLAIENAHLFTMTDQALQARVEELTAIQHIDRQLNATLDYREVMELTLSWAIRLTGATIGIIAALHQGEDGTQGLQFLANEGYPLDLFRRYSQEELWPIARGLMGKTAALGRTTLVTDVEADADYVVTVAGMRAQLTVPIQRESRTVGIIALESEDPEVFSPDAMEALERMANHAAIAIDNARLFQEVQRANQAKTEFVSFISHELKQPMTSMKGYTDLLMKGIGGPLNEQQQQFLEVVSANTRRMDRLISDLLDISRIEAGRLWLETGTVRPERVTEDATRAFEQAVAEKNQALSVEMAPELPTLQGDRERLIQVLTNLISNASKYTPEGGRITVRVQTTKEDGQEWVRWDVRDTGIGMNQEDLDRLFTKFFRSDSPEVRNVKGTGLGLFITRSIVEMHGGEVLVESALGEGSTFSLLLPFDQAPS